MYVTIEPLFLRSNVVPRTFTCAFYQHYNAHDSGTDENNIKYKVMS